MGLGKLGVDAQKLVAGIEASGFTEMSMRAGPPRGLIAAALPPHHRDPFDRILVTQAMAEPAHLLTADALLVAY